MEVKTVCSLALCLYAGYTRCKNFKHFNRSSGTENLKSFSLADLITFRTNSYGAIHLIKQQNLYLVTLLFIQGIVINLNCIAALSHTVIKDLLL